MSVFNIAQILFCIFLKMRCISNVLPWFIGWTVYKLWQENTDFNFAYSAQLKVFVPLNYGTTCIVVAVVKLFSSSDTTTQQQHTWDICCLISCPPNLQYFQWHLIPIVQIIRRTLIYYISLFLILKPSNVYLYCSFYKFNSVVYLIFDIIIMPRYIQRNYQS